MTNAQSAAYKLRWFLLIAGLLCWIAGAFYLLNVQWPKWNIFPGEPKTGAGLLGVAGLWTEQGWSYTVLVAGYLGLFLLTQWLFLAPRGSWRIQLGQTGRPLSLSVLIAGLMAALLSLGVLATVLELAGVWGPFAFVESKGEPTGRFWPALLVLAAMWIVWAGVFFAYWRQGDRLTRLGRMIRGLIAGSILETLVAAPVHVWLLHSGSKEDKDCYCMRGSYTGLVFGGTVLLWAFGPGIVLLFLREKQRREKLVDTEHPAD